MTRIRASDAEREEYASRLRTAIGEGRLSLAAGEERLAAAYAAVHREQLDELTTDLPGAGGRTLPAQTAYHLTWRRHTALVAVVSTVLVGVWVLTALAYRPYFFWPAITISLMLTSIWKRHRQTTTRSNM